MRNFVSYCRVSTHKQGAAGLGIESQRLQVQSFAHARGANLVAEFVEVETGKGANAIERRPMLRDALALCKREQAVLVIAKLDRLARNIHFISGLLESGVEFIACDMPEANKTMLQMFAVMAEFERDQISTRIKAALAVARLRGTALGVAGPANLKPNIEARRDASIAYAQKLKGLLEGMLSRGLSRRAMVLELNSLEIKATKGGAYSLQQLQRVLSNAGLR